MEVVGYSMIKQCTDKVFAEVGFASGNGRDKIGVMELHDCFAANEVCLNIRTSPANTHVFVHF